MTEMTPHYSGAAGGLLVGNSHAEGGIKAVVKPTGQMIEMEGDEVVITKKAVKSKRKYQFDGQELTPRQILSKINSDAGGVSFADGGEVPSKMKLHGKTYQINNEYHTAFDIGRMFADGGSLDENLAPTEVLAHVCEPYRSKNVNNEQRCRMIAQTLDWMEVPYTIMVGTISCDDFKKPNHFWIEIPDGRIIDYDSECVGINATTGVFEEASCLQKYNGKEAGVTVSQDYLNDGGRSYDESLKSENIKKIEQYFLSDKTNKQILSPIIFITHFESVIILGAIYEPKIFLTKDYNFYLWVQFTKTDVTLNLVKHDTWNRIGNEKHFSTKESNVLNKVYAAIATMVYDFYETYDYLDYTDEVKKFVSSINDVVINAKKTFAEGGVVTEEATTFKVNQKLFDKNLQIIKDYFTNEDYTGIFNKFIYWNAVRDKNPDYTSQDINVEEKVWWTSEVLVNDDKVILTIKEGQSINNVTEVKLSSDNVNRELQVAAATMLYQYFVLNPQKTYIKSFWELILGIVDITGAEYDLTSNFNSYKKMSLEKAASELADYTMKYALSDLPYFVHLLGTETEFAEYLNDYFQAFNESKNDYAKIGANYLRWARDHAEIEISGSDLNIVFTNEDGHLKPLAEFIKLSIISIVEHHSESRYNQLNALRSRFNFPTIASEFNQNIEADYDELIKTIDWNKFGVNQTLDDNLLILNIESYYVHSWEKGVDTFTNKEYYVSYFVNNSIKIEVRQELSNFYLKVYVAQIVDSDKKDWKVVLGGDGLYIMAFTISDFKQALNYSIEKLYFAIRGKNIDIEFENTITQNFYSKTYYGFLLMRFATIFEVNPDNQKYYDTAISNYAQNSLSKIAINELELKIKSASIYTVADLRCQFVYCNSDALYTNSIVSWQSVTSTGFVQAFNNYRDCYEFVTSTMIMLYNMTWKKKIQSQIEKALQDPSEWYRIKSLFGKNELAYEMLDNGIISKTDTKASFYSSAEGDITITYSTSLPKPFMVDSKNGGLVAQNSYFEALSYAVDLFIEYSLKADDDIERRGAIFMSYGTSDIYTDFKSTNDINAMPLSGFLDLQPTEFQTTFSLGEVNNKPLPTEEINFAKSMIRQEIAKLGFMQSLIDEKQNPSEFADIVANKRLLFNELEALKYANLTPQDISNVFLNMVGVRRNTIEELVKEKLPIYTENFTFPAPVQIVGNIPQDEVVLTENDLTADEIDSINSQDFSDWFGDWQEAQRTGNYANVSKAVQPNGMPMPVYHGTPYDFMSFVGEGFPIIYFARSFWYSYWFANARGTGNIFKCFVDIKDPIDLRPFGVKKITLLDFVTFLKLRHNIDLTKIISMEVIEKFTSLQLNPNSEIDAVPVWVYVRGRMDLEMIPKFLSQQSLYDGIIMYENNPNDDCFGLVSQNTTCAYLCFNPNQIKLTKAKFFSKKIDDVRFQWGGIIPYSL